MPHSLESALAAADLALHDSSIRESQKRFPDGARYRIEIASVEGPTVLKAVISEAENQGIRVHRVSQGSGVMMLSDAELDEMAQLSEEHEIEVGLYPSGLHLEATACIQAREKVRRAALIERLVAELAPELAQRPDSPRES